MWLLKMNACLMLSGALLCQILCASEEPELERSARGGAAPQESADLNKENVPDNKTPATPVMPRDKSVDSFVNAQATFVR
jgi:hypothetical protein